MLPALELTPLEEVLLGVLLLPALELTWEMTRPTAFITLLAVLPGDPPPP